jgi:hypothetical protein
MHPHRVGQRILHAPLFSLATSILRDPTAAKEVLQKVFVHIWERAHGPANADPIHRSFPFPPLHPNTGRPRTLALTSPSCRRPLRRPSLPLRRP